MNAGWKEHFLGFCDAIVFIVCVVILLIGFFYGSFGILEFFTTVGVAIFHIMFVKRKDSSCLLKDKAPTSNRNKNYDAPIKIRR